MIPGVEAAVLLGLDDARQGSLLDRRWWVSTTLAGGSLLDRRWWVSTMLDRRRTAESYAGGADRGEIP